MTQLLTAITRGRIDVVSDFLNPFMSAPAQSAVLTQADASVGLIVSDDASRQALRRVDISTHLS
jgi:hypothetical protein